MIKKLFKQYVLENKYDISMICMLIIIGIACGICIFFLVNDNTTNELICGVKDVFDVSIKEKILKTNVITNSLKINLGLVIILLFFSITLIGRSFIYVITVIKGMSIGIYTCILFAIFKVWWGLVAVLLLVVLVNVVYLVAYIFITSTLLAFNFEIFNTKKESANMFCVTKMLAKVVGAFVLIFSSSIMEQILTNVVFKIYEKIS